MTNLWRYLIFFYFVCPKFILFIYYAILFLILSKKSELGQTIFLYFCIVITLASSIFLRSILLANVVNWMVWNCRDYNGVSKWCSNASPGRRVWHESNVWGRSNIGALFWCSCAIQWVWDFSSKLTTWRELLPSMCLIFVFVFFVLRKFLYQSYQ